VPPAWTPHLPPGFDPGRLDLLADRSLPVSWTRRWAEHPSAPAIWTDPTGWTSAGELEQRTRRVAGRYAAAGLHARDRLLISAAPSLELVIAHVAALRLGLIAVPVNPAYAPSEVARIAADCRPRGAVVDEPELGRAVAGVTGPVALMGPEVARPDGPGAVLDQASAEDPAMIVYTSGTTGAPKGALLSHGNLLASVAAVGLAWRWTRADRLVLALPLFHIHGLGVGLHGSLSAGSGVVLRSRFDVDDVLDTAARHGGTLFFGVPTMYTRFAASPRVAELVRLRLCVSGSAPLPAEVFTRIAEASGQRVLERYGMSETVMNVSNPYDGERRPGTVGLPLPGVELRLGAAEEIQLRGPNVLRSYWGRPDATAEAFTEDGWFRSGDVGRYDDDGYLRIVGRLKELIISGGYNVYPRDIEELLRAHPQVQDVAVVGRPSPEWGEQVTAYVVAGDVTEADLLAFAARSLAPYQRPKQVVFVDELPRNALGKVVKVLLGDSDPGSR
jgi:malonyl-CoA/methylmalonyl-CoA synthetase